MAEAKAQAWTLDGTSSFDFNDRISTFLNDGFSIPKPARTTAGENRKRRGLKLKEQHYERITLNIPFAIEDADKGEISNQRDALIDIISQERWTFVWNPDPDDCSDVYFDCYQALVSADYGLLYRSGDYAPHLVEAMADPFCREPEIVLFDATTVLFDAETAEAGEWTGDSVSFPTTNFIYGTRSVRDVAVGAYSTWLLRNAAAAINLSGYLTKGYISMWLYLDSVPPDLVVWLKIGSDASNYRRWALATSGWGWGTTTNLVPGWNLIYLDYNNPTDTVGSPAHTAIDYYRVDCLVPFGQTGPNFNLDNCTISNGPICGPRARSPFIATVFGVATQHPAGFLANLKWSAAIDRLWLGRKEQGVDPFPAVVNDPATGVYWFTDPVSTGNDANCHQGQYKRYSVSSAGSNIHPGKFYFHQHKGNYVFKVRFRSYDGGASIKVRWNGYDKNGDFCYGDWKTISPSSGTWQTLDLGPVGIPLDGFSRDCTPENMYTYIGLGVGGSGAAANFDVDFICTFPDDGGGRFVAPPTSRQYMTLDTRYLDSSGVTMSTDGTADNAHSMSKRSTGGLDSLGPGVNNFAVHARLTSTPTLVPEAEITKLSYVPRRLYDRQ